MALFFEASRKAAGEDTLNLLECEMVNGNGQCAGNGRYAGNGQHLSPLGGRGISGPSESVPGESVPSEPLPAEERRRLIDLLRRCAGEPEVGEPEFGEAEGILPEEPASEKNTSTPADAGSPLWPVAEAFNEALNNRFRVVSAAQLDSAQYETRSLIPGLLAAGQPGGIFGAFKTLKTSIAADLLISLASGTPFLGRFPVPKPGRVLFLSGESGLPALQSIARRICAERGLSLESLTNFLLSPDLPRLDRPSDVEALKRLVEKEKPVCVVIDPAYLAMGGDKSRNLFAVGSLLYPLAELCESTGCTILVVHHCKRSNKLGDPATLDDIAWSGFAEFAGQWLLLSRRRPFDPGTGHHELWLTAGSRAGHHGLWEVDVEEELGPTPAAVGFSPKGERRVWRTAVRTVESALVRADERFVEASEDRRLRRRGLTVERQCQRTLEFLAAHPEGCCSHTIREALGLNGGRMSRVLDRLLEKKEIDKVEWYEDRRKHVKYRRVFSTDLSTAAIKAGRVTPPPDQKTYDAGTGQFVDRKESHGLRANEERASQLKSEEPLTACGAPLANAGSLGPDTFAESGGTKIVSQGGGAAGGGAPVNSI